MRRLKPAATKNYLMIATWYERFGPVTGGRLSPAPRSGGLIRIIILKTLKSAAPEFHPAVPNSPVSLSIFGVKHPLPDTDSPSLSGLEMVGPRAAAARVTSNQANNLIKQVS